MVRKEENVYADIGVPDPVGMLQKADLVVEIEREIQRRGLTPEDAAGVLGTSVEALDSLLHGHFHATPVEALMGYLAAIREEPGKYQSEPLEALHTMMEDLYKGGLVDQETMREFDQACLVRPQEAGDRRKGHQKKSRPPR